MTENFNKELIATGYESTLNQFRGVDHGAIVSLPLPELFGVIEDLLHP